MQELKCIICKKKDFFELKKIGDTKIFECNACKLAITETNFKKKYNLNFFYNKKDYEKRLIKLTKRYQKLLNFIYKYKKEGEVLDIGAGFGLISKLFSDNKNYKVVSVEPNLEPFLLKNTSAILVNTKAEDFFKSNRKKFDIILLFDVLEHFKNPKYILNECRKILKNDGILVIQIPNYKSFMAKICKKWSWWFVEDHFFHFSNKSINLLLKNSGFKVIFSISYDDLQDLILNIYGNLEGISNNLMRKFFKVFLLFISITYFFIFSRLAMYLKYGGIIFLISKKSQIKL